MQVKPKTVERSSEKKSQTEKIRKPPNVDFPVLFKYIYCSFFSLLASGFHFFFSTLALLSFLSSSKQNKWYENTRSCINYYTCTPYVYAALQQFIIIIIINIECNQEDERKKRRKEKNDFHPQKTTNNRWKMKSKIERMVSVV